VRVRLGTRGSELALAQSGVVAARLVELGHDVELTIIRTAGDSSGALAFADIGAPGVFVREIEQALIEGRIDLAVHSYKDLPTASPDELVVAAVPMREDPADVLVANPGCMLPGTSGVVSLRAGSTVGTSSTRRAAWIRSIRGDLQIKPMRGNVPTRIRKLRAGDYDAIVLAAAGLRRLQDSSAGMAALLEGLVPHRLAPGDFVPAPSQGAIAIQCRRDRIDVISELAELEDPRTRLTVDLERRVLALADGGCSVALGAHCEPLQDAGFRLTAMLERNDQVFRAEATAIKAEGLAERCWRLLQRRHVVLTRAAEDCGEWAEAFARDGVKSTSFPCIDIAPATRPGEADDLRPLLMEVDWIVFTSPRGVRRFTALYGRCIRAETRIAVVGRATAEACRAALADPAVVGAGTAAELADRLVCEARLDTRNTLLLAIAENAAQVLDDRLKASGARTVRWPVYRTVPIATVPTKTRWSAFAADSVVFSSPSAVSGFVNTVEIDAPIRIVTIGPTTSAAVREAGLVLAAQASSPSYDSILEVL
jgi:hydroxymethylbilane synthase